MAGWECSFTSCQEQERKSASLAPRSPNKLLAKSLGWQLLGQKFQFLFSRAWHRQVNFAAKGLQDLEHYKCAPRATLSRDLNKEQICACQKEQPSDLCDLSGICHISASSQKMRERKKKSFFFFT